MGEKTGRKRLTPTQVKLIMAHDTPHPELKEKLLKIYQKDPLRWYEERWGGNPSHFRWDDYPEYEGHVWDGTPMGLKHVWECLGRQQWVGCESATGQGKTYLAMLLTFWFLDIFPDAIVGTTSTKHEQLKKTLWKEINANFSRFQELHPGAKITASPLSIKLSYPRFDEDGKRLPKDDVRQAYGSTEQVKQGESVAQGAAGVHSPNMLFIMDEGSGIPPAVVRAYMNTCTDVNNLLVMLGNPKSTIDALHQFCLTPNVEHVRLSAYDHPNIVCQRSIIPGAVQQIRIDRAFQQLGNRKHPEYLALIRGISPEESLNSIIKISQIKAVKNLESDDFYDDDVGALGIDVANSVDGDKAAIAIFEGNKLVYLKDFQCPDGGAIATNMLYDNEDPEFEKVLDQYTDELDRDYNLPTLEDYNIDQEYIGVDATGVGASTINTFSAASVNAFSFFAGGKPIEELYELDEDGEPLYRFANLRSQAMYLLVRAIINKDISIVVDKKNITEDTFKNLYIELAATKRNPSNLVKTWQLENKSYTKRRLSRKSPNLSDALAIANVMRLCALEEIDINFPGKTYVGVHI
jgi:hypothetical protein